MNRLATLVALHSEGPRQQVIASCLESAEVTRAIVAMLRHSAPMEHLRFVDDLLVEADARHVRAVLEAAGGAHRLAAWLARQPREELQQSLADVEELTAEMCHVLWGYLPLESRRRFLIQRGPAVAPTTADAVASIIDAYPDDAPPTAAQLMWERFGDEWWRAFRKANDLLWLLAFAQAERHNGLDGDFAEDARLMRAVQLSRHRGETYLRRCLQMNPSDSIRIAIGHLLDGDSGERDLTDTQLAPTALALARAVARAGSGDNLHDDLLAVHELLDPLAPRSRDLVVASALPQLTSWQLGFVPARYVTVEVLRLVPLTFYLDNELGSQFPCETEELLADAKRRLDGNLLEFLALIEHWQGSSEELILSVLTARN